MRADLFPGLRPLDPISFLGPSGSIVRKFWTFQLCFWPSYGLVLMIPWIGTYTIASMIPNKIVVAATGLIAGVALRPIIERAHRFAEQRGYLIGILTAVVSIVVAGGIWDLSLSMLLRRSVDFDFGGLGAASGGVPQFAGAFYHALVLALWALGWVLIRADTSRRSAALSDSGVAATPTDVEAEPERIVMRDGRKTFVFGALEIDWVQAEGDYVRVHAGARHLLVRSTLTATDATLPPRHYIRIHRSVIVRIGHVREVHPRPNNELEVVLRDGTKLKASRTYSDKLRETLGR